MAVNHMPRAGMLERIVDAGRGETNMSQRIRVLLDLRLVQEHLSQADGKSWSREEVESWLVAAGFQPRADKWWEVSEADMGQIDPSEVVEIRPID